jgi:hypothetical protein
VWPWLSIHSTAAAYAPTGTNIQFMFNSRI